MSKSKSARSKPALDTIDISDRLDNVRCKVALIDLSVGGLIQRNDVAPSRDELHGMEDVLLEIAVELRAIQETIHPTTVK